VRPVPHAQYRLARKGDAGPADYRDKVVPAVSRIHNPFGLRARIAFIAFVAIAALAAILANQASNRLSRTYEDASRSQLQAIATTWADGFRASDLRDPALLQERLQKLKKGNASVHKISVSWHDARGRTLIAQAGHVHDPDGTKRDVTTAQPIVAPGSNPAPIDAGEYGYRDIHGTDGIHYGELNYRLTGAPGKATVAALELHYDLKKRDLAMAQDQEATAWTALIAAIVLSVVLSLVLSRTVVAPLDRIRAVANRIGAGDDGVRLEWARQDEIGDLARDFDRMADDLLEALKDPLTGLFNHRAFQERLEEELRRAERARAPVSLIALDIDDFKVINDTLGHAAGDEALRLLADAIRAELRPGDACGRLGGDEFMIVLPGAAVESADRVVARLRARTAELAVGASDQPITFSSGIAGFPEHALGKDDLLHLADGAMYWAKSHGKNRSFIYSSTIDFALSAEEAAERNLRASLVNTVHALARAVDAKDGYTHSHSQRVARYAVDLGRKLGLAANRLEQLRTAGVLHDIGKIGISDAILLKPAKLDGEEFATMRRHSELGHDIIAGAGMTDIAGWVLHLHERFDGRGYPLGLAGSAIPLESRLLHCADALEAMTSSRVYRAALPLEVAIAELESGAGSQFDPTVVAALLEMVRSGELKVGETAAESPSEL
jgi:diguanylate cyclase (GGDEF)-like protein